MLSLTFVEFLAHGKQSINGDFYHLFYIYILEAAICYSLLEFGGLSLF